MPEDVLTSTAGGDASPAAWVWGITFESESTVVDTYISYLRKKLHRDDFDGIKTIRGVGFVIQEPKK